MKVERIFRIELRPTPGGLWKATCPSFPGIDRISASPEWAFSSLRSKLQDKVVRHNGEDIRFKMTYPVEDDTPVSIDELHAPVNRLIMPSSGRLAEAINILQGRIGKRTYNNQEHWTLDGKFTRIHEIITAAGLQA